MSYKQIAAYTSLFCFCCNSVVLAQLPTTQIRGVEEETQIHKDILETSHDAIISSELLAQTPPASLPPGTLEPPRRELTPLPETLPTPTPTPPLTVPQPVPPSPDSVPEARVKVKRVEVLGSTVFSPEELNKAVEPFVDKELTFEELLEIRTAITNLYTSQGYTTSGAFLPPQDLASGVIQIQVVEGELEKVELLGLRRLKESYVRSRINLASDTPVNIRSLEQALQLLQLDPLFIRVQAELKAGTSPGRSILTLNLTEAPAFHGAFQVENRDSPTVGEIRSSVIFRHDNLLGFGDRLSAEAGFTEGVNSYDFNYDISFNGRNGTFSIRYGKSDQRVVEAPFINNDFDLTSNSETFSLGIRQPLTRTPTTEFALSLSTDLRRSQTFLNIGGEEIPFSFSIGPDNGSSKVTAIRFTQDWTNRGLRRVIAARSQFSLGIDAFDATVNDLGIDGRFFSWVGQFQYVQSLGNNIVSIARVATQLTGDALLPLEQFSVGGVDTVRGYRQNQRVADNGIIGSLEVRFPIVNNADGFGSIQLAPFFDIGTVWNNSIEAASREIESPQTLLSLGLGLRWQVGDYFSARLDWGIPLNKIDQPGNSLQDNGIFFSLFLQPF